MTLKDLNIGQTATIESVGGQGALRQHFLDMGVIPGAAATLVKLAPMGDPMEIHIHGYELTIRKDDAAQIEVCDVRLEQNTASAEKKIDAPHPGLGEGGVYHVHKGENPLPDSAKLTFALAGNQNCGKTTLFNQLTGSNQHVGNFPGVTVDRKDGVIKRHSNTLVTDLPGIYSLSPYSNEEIVTRDFLLREKPKGIINIVDATNIERNLYLTMQLMELNIPMVLALNMMDEVVENGGSILVNEMERQLGIPVIPVSAARNEGIDELVDHAVHVAHYQEAPGRTDFCSVEDHNGAVHRCLHAIMHLIEDHAKRADIPLRFAASKVAEGDETILAALHLDKNELESLEHLLEQMEAERGLDRSAAIADMRFKFITDVCKSTVIKPKESREHIRSSKIDRILTGKWSAIPSFLLIMAFVFWATFGPFGSTLSGMLETGIESLTNLVDRGLTAYGLNPVVQSLVIDGIFSGVGTVLSFLPYIIVLFFCLSLLEDSGYLARVAFVTDKLLRKIGLSGRSIVSMLIGFGCTVPAVMASRTIPSERDRKMTILLTPYMSCSAKLPIYALLAAAFFPANSTLTIISLYVGGVAVGLCVAFAFRKTLFRGEPVPFVMELPNYRLPAIGNVFRLLWEKARDFVSRAFTVIFVATIVIWFLQKFDIRLNVVDDPEQSILALIAGFIAPVFSPLGFGSWQISTALITGFMAKESVISTLTVLLGGGTAAIASFITPAAAISLLVFILLYTPCIAAIGAVKRELGRKWALFMVVGQCLVAWLVAFAVHSAVMLFI
ncbi:MAG: ferrous iron transport protein B [Bacteroidales bacterium]|nr:ferrous iron transport protein B [Candidatus Cacconaster merdequi]